MCHEESPIGEIYFICNASTVKYVWISTPKASSKGEVALTYLYTQQPGNLSNVRLQTHFNKYHIIKALSL
jgi:hypothetical protein